MSDDTDTMQPISARSDAPSSAGLLLLYADPIDCAPSVLPLTEGICIIGREPPRGGLRLDIPSVSRQHASIAVRSDGWRIADLGSRNGTFVDGRRIVDATLLRDGSEIRVGDVFLKFVHDGIEEYAPYRIDGTLASGARRRSTAVPEMVGGLCMDRVAADIEAAARTALPVLALGETGTGKELVARAVHRLSGRAGPLRAVNCAAIPAALFESELFGVRKGAFTGADRDKMGLFKAADGGTLFLDEIGEMRIEVQAKLLRVLEAREVRAVGSTQPEPVDVRAVCATNRDLKALVAEGRFRGDLLARLHGFEIVIPPLRQRKEDLYALVRHFLARARPDLPEPRLSFGFMLALCDYEWPFNVRECEAVVSRAAAVADAGVLEVAHLPEGMRRRAESFGSRVATPAVPGARSRAPEADELRASLARHHGNVAAVARELGKDPKQVHRWMRKHGITPGGFRG